MPKRVRSEREREEARAYSAAYHLANRGDVLAKMRKRNKLYYAANRQRLIDAATAYQRANPEARNRYKSAWNRQRKLTDPQFAAITMMRKLVSRTCERIKVGRREIGRTVQALGFTTAEFKAHIEAQFEEGMCWANHGAWHVDHIRALATFDLTDEAQRKAANALSNLQPLWAEDNMRKGARQVSKLEFTRNARG